MKTAFTRLALLTLCLFTVHALAQDEVEAATPKSAAPASEATGGRKPITKGDREAAIKAAAEQKKADEEAAKKAAEEKKKADEEAAKKLAAENDARAKAEAEARAKAEAETKRLKAEQDAAEAKK